MALKGAGMDSEAAGRTSKKAGRAPGTVWMFSEPASAEPGRASTEPGRI